VVWCGFRLNETDLPLRVAFPIFITNSVRWLSSTRGDDNNSATRRTGQVVPLDVPRDTREVAVTAPDNSVRRLPINQTSDEENAPLLFAATDQVGQYSAQAGKWKKTFAISLLNAAESDLQPRDALRVNNSKAVSGEGRARSNRELWGFFVAAALLLLGVEWWIYHRGV
jgi:hypothetical protein